jgi:hypothetical protein
MFPKDPTKTPKRQRAAFGVNRERTSIPDLWKEMWAGTDETNRRLRWRRWDRDLNFRGTGGGARIRPDCGDATS